MRVHWRSILARMPLPMLALAASYGVWSFNLLFVPSWVALISAAAFEATYVALGVSPVTDRRRATIIAASAVLVSVCYNTLAGLFHRRPDLLIRPPLWADVALALLHGAPLAIVAYNIAVLLLHATPPPAPAAQAELPALTLARPGEEIAVYPAPLPSELQDSQRCPKCARPLDPARWRAARRYGHCAACKTQQ